MYKGENKNEEIFSSLREKCFDENTFDRQYYTEYKILLESKLKSYFNNDLNNCGLITERETLNLDGKEPGFDRDNKNDYIDNIKFNTNNFKSNNISENITKNRRSQQAVSELSLKVKTNDTEFYDKVTIKKHMIERLSTKCSKELLGIVLSEFLLEIDTPNNDNNNDKSFIFDPLNIKVVSFVKHLSHLIERNNEALLTHIKSLENKVLEHCKNRIKTSDNTNSNDNSNIDKDDASNNNNFNFECLYSSYSDLLCRLLFVIKFIYDVDPSSNKNAELYIMATKKIRMNLTNSNIASFHKDNSHLMFMENKAAEKALSNNTIQSGYFLFKRFDVDTKYSDLEGVFNQCQFKESIITSKKIKKIKGDNNDKKEDKNNNPIYVKFINGIKHTINTHTNDIRHSNNNSISNNKNGNSNNLAKGENILTTSHHPNSENTLNTNINTTHTSNQHIKETKHSEESNNENFCQDCKQETNKKELTNIIEENSVQLQSNESHRIVSNFQESLKNVPSNAVIKRTSNNKLSIKGCDLRISLKNIEGVCNDNLDANHEFRKSNILSVRRLTEVNHTPKKLYTVDGSKCDYIKIPPLFATNDEDLRDLLNYMVEDTTKWDKVVSDKKVVCYKRAVEGSSTVMLKAIATIKGFTSKEIFDAIYDLKYRMMWDTVFKDFKVVRPQTETSPEVLYMSIKTPSVFISDRDFVQQRKCWINFLDESTYLLHFKSIEIPECPLTKMVRAHTYISGYYSQEISKDPLVTRLVIVTRNDIKGSIPKILVNKFAGPKLRQWIDNLEAGMLKIRKSVNKK